MVLCLEIEKAPRLHGWARPWVYPTGLFIRDYLLKHGEAYAQEIWRALKVARKSVGLSACTYQSFRTNYIYVLKKLGLIEPVRTERVRKGWFRRVYYRIVPGRENDPRWGCPQGALDPRRKLGSKKYKHKK